MTIIGEGPSSARLDEEALASTARLALAEPWATTRQTPLSHSLCQRVVTSGSPLVLPDARLDERTGTSLAIDDLAVVAYAGMPLTDGEGNVLGSLCAIDRRPRVWSRQELADRADLAAACCGELRLRIMSQLARQARAQVAVALQRSQLMLRAAEDLANTAGLVEVRRSVRNLVVSGLTPSYVGLILLEGQQLRRVPDPEIAYVAEIHSPVFPLDSSRPSARAVRDGEIVIVDGRRALEAEYGQAAAAAFDASGLQAAVWVPLPGTRRTLGALVLGWARPHPIDVTDRAVLTAIAGYTAQAIGGDWYDAYPLATGFARPGAGRASAPPLAITVGDITGHDIRAATVMGQVRSMLRQADLHDGTLGPAGAVTAVEKACKGLSLEATGTLVHGHLRPAAGAAWQLTWTNAGHPPPLVRHRDGQTEQLGGHDLLLWPGMPDGRTDWQRVLVPGDTLLLYSDGLVEDRARGLDAAIAHCAALLSAAPVGQPLPDLLSELIEAVAGTTTDDIALLAVRIPETRPA